MWRSFVNSFTNNTYENYLKKHLATSDLSKSKEKRPKSESVSLEAQKMTRDYLVLQKKVEEQRKNIKDTDDLQGFKRKMKIHKENELRLLEKDRKNSFLQKIRSYSNNKAKKKRTLDDFPKESQESVNGVQDVDKEIREFGKNTCFVTSLRPSSPVKIFVKPSSRSNSKKNTVNLKEYQEKVMKEFKKTLPKDYYDQLENEFLKIRKKSEETFEQYKLSKKLKKSNPYNVRPKTRACSNIDFLFN